MCGGKLLKIQFLILNFPPKYNRAGLVIFEEESLGSLNCLTFFNGFRNSYSEFQF
ncbi:hypothetical protein LEP1GSC050_0039 [Leptospira phage vB_LbrZ_5399-LE1]|nr:hypothetical protein LEP1GSC050_0039 [Leptospira phage vB_LbrZ_5399-LE1]AGS80875.1 hypothetical protein LEP1GSC047_0832 [Leptospira phage vB_LinZ_10-LE1]